MFFLKDVLLLTEVGKYPVQLYIHKQVKNKKLNYSKDEKHAEIYC